MLPSYPALPATFAPQFSQTYTSGAALPYVSSDFSAYGAQPFGLSSYTSAPILGATSYTSAPAVTTFGSNFYGEFGGYGGYAPASVMPSLPTPMTPPLLIGGPCATFPVGRFESGNQLYKVTKLELYFVEGAPQSVPIPQPHYLPMPAQAAPVQMSAPPPQQFSAPPAEEVECIEHHRRRAKHEMEWGNRGWTCKQGMRCAAETASNVVAARQTWNVTDQRIADMLDMKDGVRDGKYEGAAISYPGMERRGDWEAKDANSAARLDQLDGFGDGGFDGSGIRISADGHVDGAL
eukprot:NODE_3029_length_1043_cov_128.356987_g2887_i0.p1 GENE.NODE_3029_length_1043_cov_128.356987_g2887_i0~~NODE_3029_length_1043_cov_128.356987_g2887_i0.p1  ORF type:complete len:292 (+),score=19.16 NODE_3029_length_1043_cov_128.356987_g2887_i0:54-929(+)